MTARRRGNRSDGDLGPVTVAAMAEAEGAGQPDAVLLAPLSEDTFLHNLHVRYKRDIIYVSSARPLPRAARPPPDARVLQTYVGNALVSVNPCRALPLYSAELVRAYLARPPYQLPPHLSVYALIYIYRVPEVDV